MSSSWLRSASAWPVAALLALLVLGPVDAPVSFVSLATLAIAAVVAWSLLRPAAAGPRGAGVRLAVASHRVGAMRSFDPDAPGRPRPRAPGA
jgi:hypothetical protein